MKTRITELLGIQYPIIQGGMAWVAEHHLAAAVSAAGGLGLIGGANAPGEVVREEIRKARELTDKPIGVNVMLLSPHADDVARVVVEEGIKVVTTGAGNPEKYMDMWKAAGIKVIPVVASVALAKRMEKYGADAVVAEGMESGGHIGEQTTMTLVPQVVDAVSIPVIASGGAGTKEHFYEALTEGKADAALAASLFHYKELEIMDLKKYLAMYLNEGKTPEGIRILGSTGIREMCRPRQDYGAFGYYGYGLSMKRLDDLKVVEHGGSLPGVSSNIAWSNEAEAAVIVLCNTSGVPVRLISDALMRMYNGRNPVDRRDVWQETSWDEETILEAQGMYISGEGTKAELYRKKDGSLGARENGKEIPIIPVGPKTAIVRNQYSDLFIRLIQNESRGIYAIAYGSRLIPKSRQEKREEGE